MPSLSERRLLDVAMAAAYPGDLGEDTVRVLDASGVLTPARERIVSTGCTKKREGQDWLDKIAEGQPLP